MRGIPYISKLPDIGFMSFGVFDREYTKAVRAQGDVPAASEGEFNHLLSQTAGMFAFMGI
jgi:hypothetical protein